jgi:NAD(P)-dependent dehydrogenase (short-subunit alcohol dehydrogenase family)
MSSNLSREQGSVAVGVGALTGKVAIVTGGGSGIGRAIATRFVREGAAVIIAGRSPSVDTVAHAIGALAVRTDVSREEDVTQLFEICRDRYHRLDVLVNNAGVTGPVAHARDIRVEDWDETMAVNVRGVWLCMKHGISLMRTAGGSIINMSSLTGLRGYPMRSAYAASKFAVLGITESVAQEVGVYGIRVNALCPGAVRGDLMERVVAQRVAAEGRSREEIIKAAYTEVAALRKWVEPEDVAEAALFLATDASSAISGERIKVDAGRL